MIILRKETGEYTFFAVVWDSDRADEMEMLQGYRRVYLKHEVKKRKQYLIWFAVCLVVLLLVRLSLPLWL